MSVDRDGGQARAPSKHDFDGLALSWLRRAGALCAQPASTVRVLAPLRVPSLPKSFAASSVAGRIPFVPRL